MQEKTLCAVYTRVSTDNQAEKEFNSCESQRKRIEHFIKSQEGFGVYDYFNDEGFSGKDLDRPEFQRMIRSIEKGYVDCVITYKMDRLTRSPKDFYHLIEIFDKYKVDFISVTERFDTSTPAGRLLRNIMLTFAQFEREISRERTMDKLLQRAQEGMWNGGTVPFGYKLIHKRLVINEREAKIVTKMFDMYIEKRSITRIYNYLKKNKIRGRGNKIMGRKSIEYILNNIVYTGKTSYAGKIYEGQHKAIIIEGIFNKAITGKRSNKRKWRQYKAFLFQGIVKCAHCGNRMTPCFSNKKVNNRKLMRYYYYRCTKTYNSNWHSCGVKQVNANRLEEYLFDSFSRMAIDRQYLESSSLPRVTHQGLGKNVLWSRRDNELFQEQLKKFLKAAEKNSGTAKCHLIKNYVVNIILNRETIQIDMYDGTRPQEEKGSRGHARDESAMRQQVDCGKSMNSKILQQDKNGRACRIDAGGMGDGPRRSAEGRGAGGHPASAASYRAAEGLRGGEAERSSEQIKILNRINFRGGRMAPIYDSYLIIPRILTNSIHQSRKYLLEKPRLEAVKSG